LAGLKITDTYASAHRDNILGKIRGVQDHCAINLLAERLAMILIVSRLTTDCAEQMVQSPQILLGDMNEPC